MCKVSPDMKWYYWWKVIEGLYIETITWTWICFANWTYICVAILILCMRSCALFYISFFRLPQSFFDTKSSSTWNATCSSTPLTPFAFAVICIQWSWWMEMKMFRWNSSIMNKQINFLTISLSNIDIFGGFLITFGKSKCYLH